LNEISPSKESIEEAKRRVDEVISKIKNQE